MCNSVMILRIMHHLGYCAIVSHSVAVSVDACVSDSHVDLSCSEPAAEWPGGVFFFGSKMIF